MKLMRSPTAILAALISLLELDGLGRAQMAPLAAVARSQIDSLEAEKAARSPAQLKMDSRLVHLVKKHRGERLGAGLAEYEARIKPAADGAELVDLSATVSEPLLAEIRRLGGTIVASVPRFQAIRARLPLAAAETLAARADVQFVKPAVQARTHVGPITTEGDVAHRANLARSTFNATGRGVRIGVISDSIDSLPLSQASGELGPVTALPGQDGSGLGGSGEGTAMLEIVHDLAPDAQLFFATAYLSEAQFAQNILDLHTAGCDIVVDDVGYFDESPLQDGPVAQAVEQIVADGALYFSAAGNEGNKDDNTSGTWEGDFADGGPSGAGVVKQGRVHSFGATTYDTLVTSSGNVSLFWADPAGASANDYDLYVFSADGTTLLGASTNVQNGHQDPYEFVAAAAGNRVVIVKSNAAAPRFLHLNSLRGTLAISTAGTIQGHPAAAGAFAVAATPAVGATVPFTGTAVSETFSTDGDRRVFFYSDGTPVTPGNFTATGGTVRAKPNLTAADGVKTSVAGFNPFYGTSAAAPHAAAIAGLVWSRNRALTPQQVRDALTSTATDIEAPGADRDTGAGIANALAATQSVAGGPIIFPVSATLASESFSPANGNVDPGETVTVNLTLRNIGVAPTNNLVATLQATGGVYNPGAAQSFGALTTNASATRSISFQGTGTVGSKLTATFLLSDGALPLGVATATFTVGNIGTAVAFSNNATTTIPMSGVATPYPSSLVVSGVAAPIGKLTVKLTNFTHTYPADVDVLLVSPSGRKLVLMSGAGSSVGVTNVTLTFDDAASALLPSTLVTGTYKPTASRSLTASLPAPAPAAPYTNTLSTFAGDSANGTWQLYVNDEATPDSGTIAGWTLSFATDASLTSGPNADLNPVLSQSSSAVQAGNSITYTATVYNIGTGPASGAVLTDALPAGLSFVSAATNLGTVSSVGNVVTANLGALAHGQSAVVTIVAATSAPGPVTNTVSVAAGSAENSVLNNSASISAFVGESNLAPAQPPGWSGNIVVSTAPGTTVDAATIASTDPVYLDFAYTNSGTISTAAYFSTKLSVDGVLCRTFDQKLPFAAGRIAEQTDVPLGTFAPGPHTVSLVLDADGTVAESDRSDNTVTRTFAVAGPNLRPFQRAGYTDKIVIANAAGPVADSPSLNAGDSLFAAFGIVNDGTVATGAVATASVYLDGAIIAQPTFASGLAAGADSGVPDLPLGALTAGVHTLRLVVDSTGAIAETNETDNEFVKTFVVNALPTITPIAPQLIDEDGTTGALSFTIGDAETAAAALSLSVSSSNPALVSALTLGGGDASRTIVFTPVANGNGTATVTVTVSDGNGGTATTSFLVTVNAVNDPPTFNQGPDQTVSEDAGAQTVAGWATAISAGPPDESAQTVYFQVSNDNGALFAAPPAIDSTGTLTYTPAANANGSAKVSVSLSDNGGGTDTSAVASFTITVLPVNDPPRFVKGADVAVQEDSGPQTIAGWATSIDDGPGETGQALDFRVSNDNPALFSAAPAIAADGALTFTPAANANGSATVKVQLHDDGGGADTSAVQSFTIAVQPVNDPPSFTLAGDERAAQDDGPQSIAQFAANISAGPGDESTQTVAFTTAAANPGLFLVPPAIAANGTLTFTPDPSASGKTMVTVTATDSAGAASPGQLFAIAITSFADGLGSYSGLALAPDPAAASAAQTGAITVTIGKAGLVSGKLTLGGTGYSFRGSVLNNGQIRFGGVTSNAFLMLARKTGLAPLRLTLGADVVNGSGEITGTIMVGPTTFAKITAARAAYKKGTAPAPQALVGTYTVAFPPRTSLQQGGLSEANFPQGSGVGTMKVDGAGIVSMVATLADGSKISAKGALSKDQAWALYTPTDRQRGALAGFVAVSPEPGMSDAAGTDLRWFKPASRTAKTYPGGWPFGIGVDLLGSKFAWAAGLPLLPGITAADANGNAAFATTGGEIALPLSAALRIGLHGKTSVVAPGADKLRITISARSGLVTGQFIHPTSGKVVLLHGALLPTPGYGAGFFLSPAQSGGFTIVPAADP